MREREIEGVGERESMDVMVCPVLKLFSEITSFQCGAADVTTE